jgi:hypothetical protein
VSFVGCKKLAKIWRNICGKSFTASTSR